MRRRLSTGFALALLLGLSAGAVSRAQLASSAKRQGTYFVGNFNTCDFSHWHTQGPANAFRIVPAPTKEGRCAAALTIGPWASGGLGSPQADGAALWLPPAPYGKAGSTVWEHFSVRFASGFQAVPGEWNLFAQWHNDGGWTKFGQTTAELSNVDWMVSNQNGISRIRMRIMGGSSSAPTTIRVDGPRLRTDHWYDFRARTVWSPDPSRGRVQWWLDGKRLYSRHVATLYTRPDGSVSSVYFILDHYRRHAETTTTIFLDGARLGRTRASVRY